MTNAPLVRVALSSCLVIVALTTAACSDERRQETPSTFVTLVFTRDERPEAVRRPAGAPPTLEQALTLLLTGPSEAERQSGLTSWFSQETSGALRSVSLTQQGHAVVDLADLRAVIPNASSSAGSATLLHELGGTAFAVEGVRAVTFTMDGSCDTFWSWLQRSCTVLRPGQIP